MITVFVGMGSNLGDRFLNLRTATHHLKKIPLTGFLTQSRVYETKPVGGPPQNDYLNLVCELSTGLRAEDFLNALLEIEQKMGRVRSEKNEPRLIDLDLLFYGDEISQKENMNIPHPRINERLFVLVPLNDIAPDWQHPVLKKKMSEILKARYESDSESQKITEFTGV